MQKPNLVISADGTIVDAIGVPSKEQAQAMISKLQDMANREDSAGKLIQQRAEQDVAKHFANRDTHLAYIAKLQSI